MALSLALAAPDTNEATHTGVVFVVACDLATSRESKLRSFNFTSRPALISDRPEVERLSVHQPGARTRAAARPLRCVVSCGGVVSARAKWHAHRTIVGCTLPPTPTPMWKKHLRPAARFVLRRATHAQGEPSCRSGVRPLGTGSPLCLCAIEWSAGGSWVGAGLPSCCPSSVLSCARARSAAMCAWRGARWRGECDHRTAPGVAALRRPCPRSTPRLRPELPRAGTGRPMAMVRSDTRQRNEFCAWCVIRAHAPTGPVGCKTALLAVSFCSSRPFRLPPALLGRTSVAVATTGAVGKYWYVEVCRSGAGRQQPLRTAGLGGRLPGGPSGVRPRRGGGRWR